MIVHDARIPHIVSVVLDNFLIVSLVTYLLVYVGSTCTLSYPRFTTHKSRLQPYRISPKSTTGSHDFEGKGAHF